MDRKNVFIHPDAEVAKDAVIGEGSYLWKGVQVREGAVVGANCILSKGVYIEDGVRIGNKVKIQNNVSVYKGVTLEDGVFVGPHCVFTNDLNPRSVNPDGTLKSAMDWTVTSTLIRQGASLGAGSIVRCGITIGEWAMTGAGSVITKDVSPYQLVYGNPAQPQGYVCRCGARCGTLQEAMQCNGVHAKG